MAGRKKRPSGRYTPPVSKQVEERLRGVTLEMAREAVEAEIAAASGGLPALDELAYFAQRDRMRDHEFVRTVSDARREGHPWSALAALFEVPPATLRQRYRRSRRSIEVRSGLQPGEYVA